MSKSISNLLHPKNLHHCLRRGRSSSSALYDHGLPKLAANSTRTNALFTTTAAITRSNYAEAQRTYTLSSAADAIGLRKVLIANRGEIACRVQRTCHKWGIPTVAIYSSADTEQAWHAQMANEAYQIGTGPSVSDSYLRQDEILDIALRSGCDSIHPGYGFLSENANFAAVCAQAGIQFIGPPASAITAMGDKAQSKAIMDAAGVPTTPGYYEATDSANISSNNPQDPELLYNKAVEIGFPLLIKAVAGGGGKGMRIVWSEKEFMNSLESCQREALNSFGNATVLLEKYLVKPRHIEIQVIADTHGNALYLHERDCSVQRRHQKVFEEAPALDLHQDLRKRFGEMGVVAAQAVNYVNAGTVEFLLDTNTDLSGTPEQPFYFCEMNTRLQVEHPVTEYITGVDLVEWQLRVAAGQQLPIVNQSDVPCNGHAIEARIYAERQTADGGFLPATGTLWHHNYDTNSLVSTPDTVSPTSVRVDTGLLRTTATSDLITIKEQEISVYYDPMISKLIVHGPDRATALQQMIHSLQKYHIAGVPTNIPFLLNCANHPAFQAGGKQVTTGFLEDYGNDVRVNRSSTVDESSTSSTLSQLAGAFAVLLQFENRFFSSTAGRTIASRKQPTSRKPWSSEWGSWRIGDYQPRQTLAVRNNSAGTNSTVQVWKYRDGSYDIQPAGGTTKYHITGWYHSATNTMEIIVNRTNRSRLTTVLRANNNDEDGGTISVRMWPSDISSANDGPSESHWELDVVNPLIPSISSSVLSNQGGGSGTVKSPMPGKITRINVAIGDTVNAGDVIVVMEAMKMEHPLVAPYKGIITDIYYSVGDVITKDGTTIFVVQNDENESVAA